MEIIIFNKKVELKDKFKNIMKINAGNFTFHFEITEMQSVLDFAIVLENIWIKIKISKEAFEKKDTDFTDKVILDTFFNNTISNIILKDIYANGKNKRKG